MEHPNLSNDTKFASFDLFSIFAKFALKFDMSKIRNAHSAFVESKLFIFSMDFSVSILGSGP